ncbi:MAG: membrane protein insertase YidC [bacterium]
MNNNLRMFILFGVIILVFGYYAYFTPKITRTVTVDTTVIADTATGKTIDTAKNISEQVIANSDIPQDTAVYLFETELYRGSISSLSGGISKFHLLQFKSYKDTLSLLPDGSRAMEAVVIIGNARYDLSNTNFTVLYKGDLSPLRVERDSIVLAAVVEGRTFTRTYVFSKDSYIIEHKLSTSEPISSVEYLFEDGVSLTEKNAADDMLYYSLDAYSTNNVIKTKQKNVKNGELAMSGSYSWMGIQTKYFFSGLIGEGKGYTAGLLSDKRLYGRFSFSSPNVLLYMGPIDYKILKGMNNGMDKLPDFGWSIIQPISKGILGFIHFMYRYVRNYGVIIIIISILLIALFSPLTFKSYSSMSKMQTLQPEMEALKKKYEKDPQRLNTETMNLYKKSGVNPFTGCLPMFIQMPVFFALYAILKTTIELRYAPFAFWLTDLASKDPYYVLPILTGATMFVSQKLSLTNQSQKMMVYIMPIMLTFLFLSLPSGINLYWLTYNLLSVVQQIIIKKAINKQTGVQNG